MSREFGRDLHCFGNMHTHLGSEDSCSCDTALKLTACGREVFP